MAIFIVTLLIQAAFIIHVMKTGRNTLWIWVLIIPGLAFVGMLAYLFVEILPELFRSRTARRTAWACAPTSPSCSARWSTR